MCSLLTMKFKTIELIIETELSNEDILTIMNEGTQTLKEFAMNLKEIRVKGSADSIIKGIDYSNKFK